MNVPIRQHARRLLAASLIAWVGWAPGTAVAPAQISSAGEYQRTMRRVADAFEAIDDAVRSHVFLLNSVRGTCLTHLDTARENLLLIQRFFADIQKDDATAFATETLALMKTLREELAAATPDQAATIEATEAVARACAACHAVYREGTPETGYRFKTGTF